MIPFDARTGGCSTVEPPKVAVVPLTTTGKKFPLSISSVPSGSSRAANSSSVNSPSMA